MPVPSVASIEIDMPLLVDVGRPNGKASRSHVRVPVSIPIVEMPVVGRFRKGADQPVEYRGRDGTPFRVLLDPATRWGHPTGEALAGKIGSVVQSRFLPPLGIEHALTGETVRSYGVPIGDWDKLEGYDLTAATPRVELAREAAWRNLSFSAGEIHVATPFPIWRANPEANSVALDDPSIDSSGFVINGQFGIRRLEAATAYVGAVHGGPAPQVQGAVQYIDPEYDRVDDLAPLAAALVSIIADEIGPELVELPAGLVGAFHEVDATRRTGELPERDRATEVLTAIVRLRDWIVSPAGANAPGHGRLEREWRKCRIRLLQVEGIVPLTGSAAPAPGGFR